MKYAEMSEAAKDIRTGEIDSGKITEEFKKFVNEMIMTIETQLRLEKITGIQRGHSNRNVSISKDSQNSYICYYIPTHSKVPQKSIKPI